MRGQPRIYDAVLQEHFAQNRQMALVSGPRQVGKTTTCRQLAAAYLNWDNTDDRRVIQGGPAAVVQKLGIEKLAAVRPIVVFDELHKFRRWKSFAKGLFDVYEKQLHVLITGSARLEVFRRGGDSLMGRYFPYRMHPYSVAERVRTTLPQQIVQLPLPIADIEWDALWQHGGFPEPFLRREMRFTNRWRALRREQLMKEDIREVAQIQDLGALETLNLMLEELSGQQLNYTGLARQIGISTPTVQRWTRLFEDLHVGFTLRPWFTNLNKALRKEPKWYSRDWSGIKDGGARAETFVACHLLKAVEGWTDLGYGRFELRYLRDKLKREVDFLIVRDRKPWCLVEVKMSATTISDSLRYFRTATKASHAFQVVIDLPFVDADCFDRTEPTVVPARTFLSQLL